MTPKESRLRWLLVPISVAAGTLGFDAAIVASDYMVRSRVASAAPAELASLNAPSRFDSVVGERGRSRALFVEAAKTLQRDGRTLGALCGELKARNGGDDVAVLNQNVVHGLRGWTLRPEYAHASASQQVRLVELLLAWVEAGAECPAI